VLVEKREALHNQLEELLKEKESTFAKKKERFELPMERKLLYENWQRQVAKSQTLATERDAKRKLLAERKALHAGIVAMLDKMGAPMEVVVDKTLNASLFGGDASKNGAVDEPSSAKKEESLSLFSSIRRLFKRSGGNEA